MTSNVYDGIAGYWLVLTGAIYSPVYVIPFVLTEHCYPGQAWHPPLTGVLLVESQTKGIPELLGN